jgi:hypothetical protein
LTFFGTYREKRAATAGILPKSDQDKNTNNTANTPNAAMEIP